MATKSQGRVTKRYRFKGPLAGQDRVLGGYLFQAGELVVTLPESEHVSLARFFAYWQAEEVKDDGKRDVPPDRSEDVEGDVRQAGEGAASGAAAGGDDARPAQTQAVDPSPELVPRGAGSPETVGRLRLALLGLDPHKDAHWTSSGKPAIAAVEAAYGHPVMRAQIEAALPGYNRKGMS